MPDVSSFNLLGTTLNLKDTNARAMIASNFDNQAFFNQGDFTLYNNQLYRFVSAHMPGEWNSNEVVSTTVAQELNNGNYITPEMFNAVGDGIADDTNALIDFMNDPCLIRIFTAGKIYKVTNVICPNFPGGLILGYNSQIKDGTSVITSSNKNKNLFQNYTTLDTSVTSDRELIIYGLTINGNASNYSFETAMGSNGCSLIHMVGFKNVIIKDCYFSDSGQAAVTFLNVKNDVIFENSSIIKSGRYVSEGMGQTIYPYFRWEGLAVINQVTENSAIRSGRSLIVNNCYFDHILNSVAAASNFKNKIITNCTITNGNIHVLESHIREYTPDVNIIMENINIDKLSGRLLTVENVMDGANLTATLRNIKITNYGGPAVFDPHTAGTLIYIRGSHKPEDASETYAFNSASVIIDNMEVYDCREYNGSTYTDSARSHEISIAGNLTVTNSIFDMDPLAKGFAFYVDNKVVLDNVYVSGNLANITRAATVTISNSHFITPDWEDGNNTTYKYALSNCTNSVRLINNVFQGFRCIVYVNSKSLKNCTLLGNDFDYAYLIMVNSSLDWGIAANNIGRRNVTSLGNLIASNNLRYDANHILMAT